MSFALERLGVAHAKVETDELDRVVPQPPIDELVAITERNLRAVWATFAERGHTRLILSGVMIDLPRHLRWFGRIVGTADVRAVRLVADDRTLQQRIEHRDEQDPTQLDRSLAYAATIREQATPEGVLVLDTTNLGVGDVAAEIVRFSGWAPA